MPSWTGVLSVIGIVIGAMGFAGAGADDFGFAMGFFVDFAGARLEAGAADLFVGFFAGIFIPGVML